MIQPLSPRPSLAALTATSGLAATIAVALGRVAETAHGTELVENTVGGRADIGPDGTSRTVDDPSGGGVIWFVSSVRKAGPATAAHIHEAPAGAKDDAVVMA